MTVHRCGVADPPWLESGGGGRGAQNHYPLLRLSEIARVIHRSGVEFAHDAHFWCWVTDNYLPDGMSLLEQLGFRYVRTLVWIKTKTPDEPEDGLQQGLGQYLRGSHELCLLGVRGRTSLPEVAPSSVIFAPRTKHSAKPEAAFRVFEAVSPGPRVELFARVPRPGWTAWGNEIPAELQPSGASGRPW